MKTDIEVSNAIKLALKKKKYYIIKPLNNIVLNNYLMEFSEVDQTKIYKHINLKDEYLLIEKTKQIECNELYTNLHTFTSGCSINWLKYAKNCIIYDYSGIISLIHINEMVLTFDEYNRIKMI